MCMSQNYTPTEWIDNRTVGTASVMNNMEKGIEDAHDRIDGLTNGKLDKEIKEVVEERGNYASLKERLDYIESQISEFLNM